MVLCAGLRLRRPPGRRTVPSAFVAFGIVRLIVTLVFFDDPLPFKVGLKDLSGNRSCSPSPMFAMFDDHRHRNFRLLKRRKGYEECMITAFIGYPPPVCAQLDYL